MKLWQEFASVALIAWLIVAIAAACIRTMIEVTGG